MSADNGIYILETLKPPIKIGNCYENQFASEFRVGHCQAIDNIDYSDLYLPCYFKDSPVFNTLKEATELAKKLAEEVTKDGFPLEYGISHIRLEKYFPNITARAASVALDCYVGAKPLDI